MHSYVASNVSVEISKTIQSSKRQMQSKSSNQRKYSIRISNQETQLEWTQHSWPTWFGIHFDNKLEMNSVVSIAIIRFI